VLCRQWNASTHPASFRRHCLSIWLRHGDGFRSDITNDFLLIKLLHVLLPPYKGPALTLFRGETFWNRCRRTYGMAWTTNIEVARDYAGDKQRRSPSGSVVLSTCAPAAAIICAPKLIDNRYGEDEILVDRRKLHHVAVVTRIGKRAGGH
jgi:hypothetical protein